MAAYLVVEIEIIDPELYQRYIEQVPAVVYDHGGRYVTRTSDVVPLAGGWAPDRMIIIEFPTMDALVAFGTSPAYRRLADLRERSTQTRSLASRASTPHPCEVRVGIRKPWPPVQDPLPAVGGARLRCRLVIMRGMSTDRNKAVVRAFDDLGNGHGDLGRLDDLCTPDMVNHALAPGAKPGLEGTRDFLRRARRDAHPARWLESHVVAEGDMVVQFGTREHDWPGGSFRGFDVPAGTYTRDTAFAYRIADGRIAERWAIRDDLAMLLQLGALPDRR